MIRRKMNDARYSYKPTGKLLWTMAEGENIWRPWGTKNWTTEDLEKYREEFKEIGYKDIMLTENDGTDPNKTMVHDDYGWEIPSDKAWDAYESLKEEMGAKQLLLSLELALGDDEIKKATVDIAKDWDEETDDIDELVAITDEEEVLDELANWMSSDDLAENIAYICRMNDVHIPELVEEEEVEVDDALWVNPDNNAGSAGVLKKNLPIKYNNYLILTREDGKFDVYTRRGFDLVGTAFKSVEEAKKNIDEGRTIQNTVTKSEEDFDEDDKDVVEVEGDTEVVEEDDDPDAKQVQYSGYRFKKAPDGTWNLIRGKDIGSRKPLIGGVSFGKAVKWLFANQDVPLPTGKDRNEQIIMKYLPTVHDSTDKVTEEDIIPGLVFAYSINPAKHFVVKTPAYEGEVIFKTPKETLFAAKVADLVHDLNTGELILVSKGE